MSSSLSLGMISIATLTSIASAQPAATLWWEVNDGNGWQTGDIATTSSTLAVRMMGSWTGNAIFELTAFDATIASPTGSTDTVSDFFQHDYLRFNNEGFAAFRFGNVLKIDRPTDSALPGQGTRWISPYQSTSVPERLLDNPIELFRYSLTLDTTQTGLRTISQVHFPLPSRQGGSEINVVSLDFGGDQPIAVPTTRFDARINYIPSPGSLALLAGISGFVTRRRR